MEEVEYVKRMREKEEFDASLPPLSDSNAFARRKKMLEERELMEWGIREEEMKKEQEEKLKLITKEILERQALVEQMNNERIENVRKQKEQELQEFSALILKDRIKLERTLQKDLNYRQEIINNSDSTALDHSSSHQRDIIKDYTDFSSSVYAPIQRDGKMPSKNQVIDYGIPLLGNFQGLTELENVLPHDLKNVVVQKPKKIIPASFRDRKGQQIYADLTYADQLLEKRTTEKPKILENVYKKYEPLVRANPIQVKAPDHESVNLQVILLQRLLRGRAVQNAMFEGKNHHRHLIEELRLQESNIATQQPDLQEEANTAIDTINGAVISNVLDYVRKEIARLYEEKRVNEYVKEAVEQRRKREAEESGRRQVEDVLRHKRQEQFDLVIIHFYYYYHYHLLLLLLFIYIMYTHIYHHYYYLLI